MVEEGERSHRFAHDPRRADPKVLLELDKWWHAALRNIDDDDASEGDDDDDDELLDYEDYRAFHLRLVHAFSPHGDDSNVDALSAEDYQESLAADWANDARDGAVKLGRFSDTVFDLALTHAGDDDDLGLTHAGSITFVSMLRQLYDHAFRYSSEEIEAWRNSTLGAAVAPISTPEERAAGAPLGEEVQAPLLPPLLPLLSALPTVSPAAQQHGDPDPDPDLDPRQAGGTTPPAADGGAVETCVGGGVQRERLGSGSARRTRFRSRRVLVLQVLLVLLVLLVRSRRSRCRSLVRKPAVALEQPHAVKCSLCANRCLINLAIVIG